MSEDKLTPAAAARQLVAEAPVERTRIIVVSDDDLDAISRIPIPLLKAAGLVTGGAVVSGAGAAWWASAASTGALLGTPVGWAAGAGAALTYPAYRHWLRPYMPLLRAHRALDARLVASSVAARLRMPHGPAETNTLYGVHPRRSSTPPRARSMSRSRASVRGRIAGRSSRPTSAIRAPERDQPHPELHRAHPP